MIIRNSVLIESIDKYQKDNSRKNENILFGYIQLMIDNLLHTSEFRGYSIELKEDMSQLALLHLFKGIGNFNVIGTVTKNTYITIKHENPIYNKRRGFITNVINPTTFMCFLCKKVDRDWVRDSDDIEMRESNIDINNAFSYFTGSIKNAFLQILAEYYNQNMIKKIEMFDVEPINENGEKINLCEFYSSDSTEKHVLDKMMEMREEGFKHQRELDKKSMGITNKRFYKTRIVLSKNNLWN